LNERMKSEEKETECLFSSSPFYFSSLLSPFCLFSFLHLLLFLLLLFPLHYLKCFCGVSPVIFFFSYSVLFLVILCVSLTFLFCFLGSRTFFVPLLERMSYSRKERGRRERDERERDERKRNERERRIRVES